MQNREELNLRKHFNTTATAMRLASGSISDLKPQKQIFKTLRRKAVTDAWELEAQLVAGGYSTRKWTLNEQKELLEKGKVTNYEGHHMYSASKHPFWAGVPTNIQFLQGSRYSGDGNNEHTHVHQLYPDMSTRGYYDVETKQMHNFKEGEAPERVMMKLERTYINDYAEKNNVSLDSAIEHHAELRRAYREEILDMIEEKGIAHAIAEKPQSPIVIDAMHIIKQKVIKKAWKTEVYLVSQGKGTRQWTLEEQMNMLKYGRVRGYDPHHMKSSFTYPEYADSVENIQFLRIDENEIMEQSEHFKAHDKGVTSPSNGYYDPETGEVTSFGDNPPSRPTLQLKVRAIDIHVFADKKSIKQLLNNERNSKNNKKGKSKNKGKKHKR